MGKKGMSFGAMILTAGAFISYTVGSGFASGNEVLQFYGSWGFPSVIFAIIAGVLMGMFYCACLFWVGYRTEQKTASETYFYFGGKILGWFFQIFIYLFIVGCYMLMFSGAGNVLHQQFGIPKWVGAVILGVVSMVVILGGLKTVENVLGCAGVVILLYVLIFTVISIVNPGSSMDQASAITEGVKNGQIMQANLFGMYPFSLIPGLEGLNGPITEGVLYITVCLVSGFPFYYTLGKRAKSGKEAALSGVVSAVLFFACVATSLYIMLTNGNSLIDPATGEMYAFPILAAINKLWPAGSWTYSLIIFVGIFTTTTGYLWVINDLFFPNSATLTSKGKILMVGLLVFGILFGGVVPFSALINFMFPLTGVVGLIIVITIAIKTFSLLKQNKTEKNCEEELG